MSNVLNGLIKRVLTISSAFFSWQLCQHSACANPTGGTVAQGTASFNTSGSQETITTSANAYINWQSFNIAAGETTTFVQPSSSSVVWNSIGGGSASQILGNLNANGYVILQNQSGFYVGGQASITAHGLIMTTASAAPNLSSGGSWDFDSPPPTAEIINYGQINTVGGGSAFLIADNIENNGTISAPSGNIGLYAGEQVLVSMSPDGRGLSAAVTLPQGSVDNQGNLIADGGAIDAQAQTVNQSGLIQANSVQNVNGTIELVASDSLNVGANSVISASGDSTASGASPGGFVVLQSGNTYADTPTSTINVTGQNGGQNGIVEIFGANLVANPVQSIIGNTFVLLENLYDLTLSSNPTAPFSQSSENDFNFNLADLAAYSQIDLHTLDNIELSAPWTLNDPGSQAWLSLQAGNSLILDDGSDISAGNNWNVNLVAGTGFVPTAAQSAPASGSDGVYLNGSAYIQTQNGNISISAVNEVQVGYGGFSDQDGSSGIRTLDGGLDGGNISVTTQYGDVNTGANSDGFTYSGNAPYYIVSQSVGGISTVNGGNVSIAAGGNVISYLPGVSDTGDAGSGAFGSNPGNVTITAGGSVYGHYVLADGTGTITAGANVGGPEGADGFALSLINGMWNVNALSGDIYLQEVRNPNGDFNDLEGGTRGHLNTAGQYWFNYSPDAAVNLDAVGVNLTDLNIPQLNPNIPVLYPPILNITAGSGGVTLEGDVTLFPSVDQSLTINISDGGNLQGPTPPAGDASSVNPELLMSDSPGTQWTTVNNFGDSDLGYANAVEPAGLTTGLNPVVINVSGNMQYITLTTSKETQITVDGDMINCAFSGQNLHSGDSTTLTVVGEILNPGVYAYADDVTIPSVPVDDLLPGMGLSWDDIFELALNPLIIATLTLPQNTIVPESQWLSYAIGSASLFQTTRNSSGQWVAPGDQGFNYALTSPTAGTLTYAGPMSQTLESFLDQPITILKLVNGQPVLNANGTFETDTVYWAPASTVQTLYAASQPDIPLVDAGSSYYLVGGPGQFDVTAGSISLGSAEGIFTSGAFDPISGVQGGERYENLASITPQGASLNVTVAGDLDMLSSTIATLGGGDLTLLSTGGNLDLGVEGIVDEGRSVGYGVFTAGPGDINVTAFGNINIDGSRIAAYDGGNIVVESDTGNVNVGSAGDTFSGVLIGYVNSAGLTAMYPEDVYGSGILALTLEPPQPGYYLPPDPATVPGNITVLTPQGNITASLGGITQEALNGNIAGGPTVTLTAGTPASGTLGQPGYSPGSVGNIDLGESGVIGGTVNITANGNVTGLVISRQNSIVNAAQNFSGSVISGGSADVGAGGSVSGVIVGVGGASVSGGSVSAQVISQNANVNGASSDSLGSTAAATSTSQSAAGEATSQAQQQVADNSSDDSNDNDDKKKKKPALLQHIKRVTVILPKSV